MTVLQRETTASGTEKRSAGLGSYFVVGVAALAVGVFGALGIQRVGEASSVSAAQQAATIRATEVGANLDSLWQVGLLQQAAINDAALLQLRIDAGLGQYEAIQENYLLQKRIEAGLLQQQAIDAANADWTTRWSEVDEHLDALVAAGLAQQEFYSNR
ncbi:MAG: hypothetical protein U9N56_10790 [Actinomycetota bacterium]|nr:hypothetical protein [Actinomycetota bacterium]